MRTFIFAGRFFTVLAKASPPVADNSDDNGIPASAGPASGTDHPRYFIVSFHSTFFCSGVIL
ncbi:hypothetical protein CKQ54_02950 [Rahnella variigena]|uniref:Uncharacterized protein n=1 Tax=Rahnella variigena TaxID=574964 RepID=A0ABX9PQT3_9GAMM|nr:hypothetical protein D6D38_17585 [Rahnella variigena]RKF67411.1 hypothetical protein CKQ54_02950 [Rahnella variigena]